LVLAVLLVIIISILSFLFSYFRTVIDLEDRIVRENDNVLIANVLHNAGEARPKLTILITFKNNQWVVLDEVRDDHARIQNICGYQICIHERITDENGNVSYRWWIDPLYVLGIQRNLNEIIHNFDTLAAYLESLEEIDAKHKWDYDWLWGEGANLKRYTIGENERIYFKTLYLDSFNGKPYTYSCYIDNYNPRYVKQKKAWRGILRKTSHQGTAHQGM
jgi:hypothetical protein